MVDWTLLGTTLGASGITGLVGYYSAKRQGDVAVAQARMETERLRVQHREDHLRNRQATYHEFLDEAATWERTRATTHAIFGPRPQTPGKEQEWQERDRRFRHLLNGVYLFGTEPVRRAAKDLSDLHTSLTVEWWTRLGQMRETNPSAEPADAVPPTHRLREWEAAVEELITAMREDVAPSTR